MEEMREAFSPDMLVGQSPGSYCAFSTSDPVYFNKNQND
jgi:hypothetical protein